MNLMETLKQRKLLDDADLLSKVIKIRKEKADELIKGGLFLLNKINLLNINEYRLSPKEQDNLLMFLELANRLAVSTPCYTEINSSKDAYDCIRKDILGKTQENVIAILLDSNNQLLNKKIVAIGSSEESIFPIQDIVRYCLAFGATKLILAHNHPNGDITPSEEDIKATKKISGALDMLNIELLDHIIVTDKTFNSISIN